MSLLLIVAGAVHIGEDASAHGRLDPPSYIACVLWWTDELDLNLGMHIRREVSNNSVL